MVSKPPLRIGYAGTLRGYDPAHTPSALAQVVKDWLWTFQVRNINPNTRSGYFLLKGLQLLKSRQPTVAEQILLHFWGNIGADNHRQAKDWGLAQQVQFEGYKSKAETVAQLAECDLLFLPLESEHKGQKPLFIPGKLYEYIQLGKPILALTGPSDCADILEKSGLGIMCDPRQPEAIARTLAELVENRATLAAQYAPNRAYIETFSFSQKTRELASLFDTLLTNHPS